MTAAQQGEKPVANGGTKSAEDFNVEEILEQLTTPEKISLVSGTDFWHTAAVPRLGVPALRTSDGPNGVRGTRFFDGVPAACLPCGVTAFVHDREKRTNSSQEPDWLQRGMSSLFERAANFRAKRR